MKPLFDERDKREFCDGPDCRCEDHGRALISIEGGSDPLLLRLILESLHKSNRLMQFASRPQSRGL
jgi:hypothetical protein